MSQPAKEPTGERNYFEGVTYMKLPGFTAELSLSRMYNHRYRDIYHGQGTGGIRPAQSLQWCGDKYLGQVTSCPSGEICKPRYWMACDGWWIFRTCDKM